MSKILHQAPCGTLPPMVPGYFILIESLPLRPIPPLCMPGLLSRLPREILCSPCPRPEMVVVTCLDWKTGGSVVVLSKCDTLCLMGCETLVALISSGEGSVKSGREAAFISTRLA